MDEARKEKLLSALFSIFANKHQASIGQSIPVQTLWLNMGEAGFTNADEFKEIVHITQDASYAVHTPSGSDELGSLALTEAGYAASRNL
jgi:hypothetical protein